MGFSALAELRTQFLGISLKGNLNQMIAKNSKVILYRKDPGSREFRPVSVGHLIKLPMVGQRLGFAETSSFLQKSSEDRVVLEGKGSVVLLHTSVIQDVMASGKRIQVRTKKAEYLLERVG